MLTIDQIKGTFGNLHKVPTEIGGFIKDHKVLTAAVVLGAMLTTATYFLFPAARAFVNAQGIGAMTLTVAATAAVSRFFATMFMFAAIHPLAAGLAACLVAVAAGVVIGGLVRGNIMKNDRINELRAEVYSRNVGISTLEDSNKRLGGIVDLVGKSIISDGNDGFKFKEEGQKEFLDGLKYIFDAQRKDSADLQEFLDGLKGMLRKGTPGTHLKSGEGDENIPPLGVSGREKALV